MSDNVINKGYIDKSFDMSNWHIFFHDDNKTEENDSDNGLLPRIWGPPTWKALHCITFDYPINPTNDDKNHYNTFFKTIGYVLPCKTCRESYTQFIENGDTKLTDDVFKDRKSLTYWLYLIHESVNKKLDVSYGVTYEDVVDIYESYRAKCDKKGDKQCIASDIQIFHNEYKSDCNIIPFDIAILFKQYAKQRGINDFDYIEQYRDLNKIKKTDIWEKRNHECFLTIKHMRENGISSLEHDGQFKGLPTKEELQLIAKLSSNLHIGELKSLSNKINYISEKKYKFVV